MKPDKCINCAFHSIIRDPDPVDWFNDDDVALVCTQKKNSHINPDSKYLADRNPHKVVGGSLRPYEVKRVDSPAWCPLV